MAESRPGPGRRDSGRREAFGDALSGKARRKLRARREGDRGIWFGLGTMGVVGWSVAIPTVLGIAVGIWLDARKAPGTTVSWTLTGLLLGVVAGCLNAWFWVRRAMEDDE